MKLRFEIDEAAYARIRHTMDATAKPAACKRLAYVYLDTPGCELAERGVALRFRRSTDTATASPSRAWRKQWLWPKNEGPRSVRALAIRGLKQRVDATFTVRVERWTWTQKSPVRVSLDRVSLSTGAADDETVELRLVCREHQRDEAMRLAVELGAPRLVTRRARERGRAMLSGEGRFRSDALAKASC